MDFLTAMLSTFSAVLSLGMFRTGSVMAGLFWGLIVLELLVCSTWWLMTHDNHPGTIVLRLFVLMILAWMMQHWQFLAGSLQDIFIQLGMSLGSANLPPKGIHGAGMSILDKGFDLFLAIQGRSPNPTMVQRLWETVDALAPTQAAMERWILSWAAYTAFIVAGIGVFLVQLQFTMFAAIAFVTIPFAAWSKTAWISDKAFGSVMACGLTLTFFYALTGVQLTVFEHYATPVVMNQMGAVSILAGGWFFVALMLSAYKLAGGLLHGVPTLTQSDLMAPVSAAVRIATQATRVIR
jgi:hypothetical protein